MNSGRGDGVEMVGLLGRRAVVEAYIHTEAADEGEESGPQAVLAGAQLLCGPHHPGLDSRWKEGISREGMTFKAIEGICRARWRDDDVAQLHWAIWVIVPVWAEEVRLFVV